MSDTLGLGESAKHETCVTVGGRKVISSGTIVCSKWDTVGFNVGGQPFKLNFDDSGNGGEESARFSIKQPSYLQEPLTLVLHDFCNLLGSGTPQPISLGLPVGGRVLQAKFAVYAFENVKILHYTFFLGD